ncbi:MAG: thermonuclease family protein [Reichenbachiella sp.]|uniref:thermonuclease family protein n=1 Tax=Reichenbachiella sp. TaxID=2184521 RepID=UPI0032636D8F
MQKGSLDMLRKVLTLILFSMPALLQAQEIFTGKVISVYNGDSFTIESENGTILKVVAMGIDAPELPQDYGLKSKEFAEKILLNKKVKAYLMPGEFYGRRECVVVTSDNIHFNYEMVVTGNAWWDYRYSKDQFLELAHKTAISKEVGLWVDRGAQPPWDWSRSKRKR